MFQRFSASGTKSVVICRSGLLAPFVGTDRSTDNKNVGTCANPVIEVRHIGAAHPDTTERSRRAQSALFRSAMDVNRAAEGVLIPGLGPRQPHDPSDDRIATRGIRLEHLAGRTASFKNRPKWRIIADFLSHLQASDGRAITARPVT